MTAPNPEARAGVVGGLPGVASDGWLAFRRWRARLRVGQRALDVCLGARSCLWLSRAAGLGFGVAILYSARPLPGTLDAVLRLALVTLSWCAGFAALSAAGRTHDQVLEAGRGLLLSRGIHLARVRAERPLAVAAWILRHVGVLALLLVALSVSSTPEPWRVTRLLGLGFGTGVYLVGLGAGLGALAHLCHVLGRGRGQALLLGLVCIPELVAPAWPELPTIVSSYGQLLEVCSSFGLRS